MYIHERADWPGFRWSTKKIAEPLAGVRYSQGRLNGHMEALGFGLRQEAVLRTVTQDVLKSSEIEGERLDIEQVRSSIARRLGIDIGALKAAERHVEDSGGRVARRTCRTNAGCLGAVGSRKRFTSRCRRLDLEMEAFVKWFNGENHAIDSVLKGCGRALAVRDDPSFR